MLGGQEDSECPLSRRDFPQKYGEREESVKSKNTLEGMSIIQTRLMPPAFAANYLPLPLKCDFLLSLLLPQKFSN